MIKECQLSGCYRRLLSVVEWRFRWHCAFPGGTQVRARFKAMVAPDFRGETEDRGESQWQGNGALIVGLS